MPVEFIDEAADEGPQAKRATPRARHHSRQTSACRGGIDGLCAEARYKIQRKYKSSAITNMIQKSQRHTEPRPFPPSVGSLTDTGARPG